MNTPIPTPKVIGEFGGTIRFAGGPLTIGAHGSEAEFARDWLAACIEKDFQDAAQAGAGIHIGLLGDLVGGGLADEAWRSSPAFETPLGREQGYVAQLLSLGLGTGIFPLLTGWGPVKREVGQLFKASAEGASERRAHWERGRGAGDDQNGAGGWRSRGGRPRAPAGGHSGTAALRRAHYKSAPCSV